LLLWIKIAMKKLKGRLKVVGSNEINSHLFNICWDLSFPSRYTIWFEIVNGVPLYKYYHFFCWTFFMYKYFHLSMFVASTCLSSMFPCFINVVTSIGFPWTIFGQAICSMGWLCFGMHRFCWCWGSIHILFLHVGLNEY
jgi:hypothetical protein